jgi:hypothetical protein
MFKKNSSMFFENGSSFEDANSGLHCPRLERRIRDQREKEKKKIRIQLVCVDYSISDSVGRNHGIIWAPICKGKPEAGPLP